MLKRKQSEAGRVPAAKTYLLDQLTESERARLRKQLQLLKFKHRLPAQEEEPRKESLYASGAKLASPKIEVKLPDIPLTERKLLVLQGNSGVHVTAKDTLIRDHSQDETQLNSTSNRDLTHLGDTQHSFMQQLRRKSME